MHQSATDEPVHSLREALARSQLTTEQLVAKIGCTRRSLSNWRNGQRPSDYYIGRLSDLLGVDLWPLYGVARLHATRRPTARGDGGDSGERLVIGGKTIDWVVIALEHFRPEQIRCTYDRTPTPLPPDLESLRTNYVNGWQVRESAGEPNLPFNSPGYKLKQFFAGYREIIDGEEVPVLRLRFGPTDYCTQIVTDLNVNHPVRKRYASRVPLTHQPVPEFASILGINLTLITQDDFAIITERHSHVYFAAGKLHTSVAEGLQRPVDAGPNGAPDPFRTARRGALEELGIELPERDLEFGAFGVQPELCQYSLFGAHRLSCSRDDVLRLRAFGIPKDKWESANLHFVPFNPRSIAEFALEHWGQWIHLGISAVVLSLWQMGFALDEIDRAFREAQIDA